MTDIRIRPADLHAERDLLVALLLRYLTPRSTVERFRWLYDENPHGPGMAWVATVGGSDNVIGSGAVIPRTMYVRGELRSAAVMADFWVHPDYRTLGPALKLQRACVEGAARYAFGFFDLPQQSMPAVYKRMKILGTERLSAYAKPLRSALYLRKKIPMDALVKLIAPVGDMWLAWQDDRRRRYDIQIHEGELGSEFTDLAQLASGRYGICVSRSAEYLTWRYRRHYYLQYEIFTARRNSQLVAYAVVTHTPTYVDVVDLFGHAEHLEAQQELLLAISCEFRRRGCSTLTMGWHGSETLVPVLSRAGLRERYNRPLIIHTFRSSETISSSPPWYLNYGDVDY